MKKSILKNVGKDVFFNFKHSGPCYGKILSYEDPMVELKYILHDGTMRTTECHEGHLLDVQPLTESLKQCVLNSINRDNENYERVRRVNEGKKVINEITAKLEELNDFGVFSFVERNCNYKGKAMVHYFNNLDIKVGDEFLIKEIEFPPDEDAVVEIITIGRFHNLEIASIDNHKDLSLQFHPYIYRVL